MKTQLLNAITAGMLLLLPTLNYAQAPPLGTAADFALFTTVGAMTNVGTYKYLTHVTGNVGTNSGSSTNFGNVNGVMHDGDGASILCAEDLLKAYDSLSVAIPTDTLLNPVIGNDTTLKAGIYFIPGAASLNKSLTLDAKGSANAVFIFKMPTDVAYAFNTSANSKVKLINGAKACNVFWQISGAVTLASGTTMKGSIIAGGAINISVNDTIEGRALTINGAVNISNGAIGVLVYLPTGCGSPYLTGPKAPTFVQTKGYAIFSSIGAVTDDGTSHIIGDVGGDSPSPTGFNPDSVVGHIYGNPVTAPAVLDLQNVVDTLINNRPPDIELLDPAELGYNLVLTPHTYIMNTAATLTDTLYLNAEGNVNAVFIIKINNHAFNTTPGAKVILINGTLAKNVYWFINNSAVSITANSVFNGTIIVNNGAIGLLPGVKFNGRALTTDGAIGTTGGMNAIIPPIINTEPLPKKQTVCAGASVSFSVVASGTGITYKWRKGNTDLVNGTRISGVTKDTLTIKDVSVSDAADNYNVIVYEQYLQNDTSTNDTLIVNQPAAPTVGTITQPTCGVATGSVVLSGLPAGSWTLNPGTITGSTASKTISGLATATHNYTVTNAAGCTSVASANVVINAQPATPVAPTVGTITQPTCGVATGSVVLSGLPAGSWTLNPGTITGSTASKTISGLATATYNYTVTNAAGCTSVASNDVVINTQPATPAAPTVGTITQPTCGVATGSVVLSGLPAGSWTLNPGTITGSTASKTLSGLATATHNYTVTNAAGCTSVASANVVINAQPATPVAPTVGTITQPTCKVATGSVVLSGLPAGSWTINPGTITGSTASKTISGLTTATYNYTVTNVAGCTSSESDDVVINAQPATPAAPTVGTITQPTCTIATGSVVLSGLPAGSWTINPGTITGSTASKTISGLATATYNYTVTNAAGCTSVASANVVINTQPATPAAPTTNLTQPNCTVVTGTITVTAPTGSGMTYSIDGSTYTNTTGIFTMVPAGTYNVTAKNSSGCISSGTSVTLAPCTGVASISDGKAVTFYPNPFTTSIDIMINDGSQINKVELRVYNVLGKEVINTIITKQITTLKTSNLPSGIYLYKVIGNNKTIQSGKLISQQ